MVDFRGKTIKVEVNRIKVLIRLVERSLIFLILIDFYLNISIELNLEYFP